MAASAQRRILIVANRTAATPRCSSTSSSSPRNARAFALLIPDAPSSEHTDWTMELALPLLERAARGPVEGLTGGDDPFEAIRVAVEAGDYDAIVISTLPRKVSKWLRRDLPRRVEALGIPVVVVTPDQQKISERVPVQWGGKGPLA